MVAFLDSSALVKLVVDEAESDALRASVGRDEPLLTSVVALVEVGRAARRVGADAEEVLGRVDLVEIDDGVVREAVAADPPSLRTLDAIQLASALVHRERIGVFVAYDRRLLDAARANGLEVAAPS